MSYYFILGNRATQPVTCVVNLHIFAVVAFTYFGSCNVYATKLLKYLVSLDLSYYMGEIY